MPDISHRVWWAHFFLKLVPLILKLKKNVSSFQTFSTTYALGLGSIKRSRIFFWSAAVVSSGILYVQCSECQEGADCTEAGATLLELPIKQGYWRYSMDILRIVAVPDSRDIPCTFGRGKVFSKVRLHWPKHCRFLWEDFDETSSTLYIWMSSIRFARSFSMALSTLSMNKNHSVRSFDCRSHVLYLLCTWHSLL